MSKVETENQSITNANNYFHNNSDNYPTVLVKGNDKYTKVLVNDNEDDKGHYMGNDSIFNPDKNLKFQQDLDKRVCYIESGRGAEIEFKLKKIDGEFLLSSTYINDSQNNINILTIYTEYFNEQYVEYSLVDKLNFSTAPRSEPFKGSVYMHINEVTVLTGEYFVTFKHC